MTTDRTNPRVADPTPAAGISGKTLGEQRPYTLIESDDPTKTFGEGQMSDWPTLSEAARAFVKSPASYKAVIFDDDTTARELNEREERFLNLICRLFGYEIDEVGA